MGFNLQDNQPATWWHVNCTGLLPSWKGQHFVLTGIATYSRYRFAFPAVNASVKTTIYGLTECLVHHLIPLRIESDQRTHLSPKEGLQQAHAYKI